MDRVPSWTDRILYHTLPSKRTRLQPELVDPTQPEVCVRARVSLRACFVCVQERISVCASWRFLRCYCVFLRSLRALAI